MPLRQYDPAIGRFNSIDPITHHEYSTYSAFDNNPAFWADPSGADAEKGKEKYDPAKDKSNLNGEITSNAGPGDCCGGAGDNGNSMTEGNTLDEVVINGSSGKSSNQSSGFDYSAMPDWMRSQENDWWNSSYEGNLFDYNSEFGTDYTADNALNQWSYQFYYKPSYDEMINDIHGATGLAAEIIYEAAIAIAPLPKLGLLKKGYDFLKHSKRIVQGVSKAKNGATTFRYGIRNIKTNIHFRLERHSFNTRFGKPISTTHINYGIGGKKHFFLNPLKKGKVKL